MHFFFTCLLKLLLSPRILRDSFQGVGVLQRGEGVGAAGGERGWSLLSL